MVPSRYANLRAINTLLVVLILVATVADAKPRAVRRACRQEWKTCVKTGGPLLPVTCPTTSTSIAPTPCPTTTSLYCRICQPTTTSTTSTTTTLPCVRQDTDCGLLVRCYTGAGALGLDQTATLTCAAGEDAFSITVLGAPPPAPSPVTGGGCTGYFPDEPTVPQRFACPVCCPEGTVSP